MSLVPCATSRPIWKGPLRKREAAATRAVERRKPSVRHLAASIGAWHIDTALRRKTRDRLQGSAEKSPTSSAQKAIAMKTLASTLFSAAAALVITLAGTCVHAAGFQHGFAADPDGKPLEIGIWYPSQDTAQPMAMGPTTMSVAVNGTAARQGPAAGRDVAWNRQLVPRSFRHGHCAGRRRFCRGRPSPTRATTMQTAAAASTSWTGHVRSAG